MIQRDHPKLSISQQCKPMKLSQSAFYNTPVGIDAETLAMMKGIDRPNQVLLSPIAAQSSAVQWVRRHHLRTGAKRVPVSRGHHGLATRKVLSWRLSNTMHADFCVDALNEAIARYGPPEIMNTDQGSQVTGSAWITTLTDTGVRISMDGRGRYLDNIFIERLWRSLKQEAVYLEEIQDGFQARRVIKDRVTFYNSERAHCALDRQTPDDAYWAGSEKQKAA